MDEPIVNKLANEIQELVWSGLCKESASINLPNWIDDLRLIARTPENQIKACLGGAGLAVYRFALRINDEHPDLENFVTSLGSECVNLLALAATAIQQNEHKEIQIDHKLQRALRQPYTRLLVSTEDRKTRRSVKQHIKVINLKDALSSGENAYYGGAESFKRYANNSKYFQDEMAAFKIRHDLFITKNMNEMASLYLKRQRDVESSISQVMGFFRIKLQEAAITLARMHGLQYGHGNINIPSSFFQRCKFWENNGNDVDDPAYIAKLKKAIIMGTKFDIPATRADTVFHYQARIYPISVWSSKVDIPAQSQKVLLKAEQFGLLNVNPFFDYYWILVPSVNINHPYIHKNDSYVIYQDREKATYTDNQEAAFAVDEMIVKKNCVIPAIIGERDGKCYFLSMLV